MPISKLGAAENQAVLIGKGRAFPMDIPLKWNVVIKTCLNAYAIGVLMPNVETNKKLKHSLLINPLENFLGYQLRRSSLVMMDSLTSELSELLLKPSTASVLLLIASNPGISQSQIGQILAIERANMAPMTAKLVNQGLLERAFADGRSHGLHLTKNGKTVVMKIRMRFDKNEKKFWAKLKTSNRDWILEMLKVIRA
jgi:DNA-binding MarR family transcriptional regulator